MSDSEARLAATRRAAYPISDHPPEAEEPSALKPLGQEDLDAISDAMVLADRCGEAQLWGKMNLLAGKITLSLMCPHEEEPEHDQCQACMRFSADVHDRTGEQSDLCDKCAGEYAKEGPDPTPPETGLVEEGDFDLIAQLQEVMVAIRKDGKTFGGMKANHFFWNQWIDHAIQTITALQSALDGLEPEMITFLEDQITVCDSEGYQDSVDGLQGVLNAIQAAINARGEKT